MSDRLSSPILLFGLGMSLVACTGKSTSDDSGTAPVDPGPTNPSQPDDTSPPTDEPAPDADGDGFDTVEDCDDGDDSVYPGADELCDGLDNDCDDEIDEDAIDALSWYTDADGDGYGDQDTVITGCELPADALTEGGDCDDSNKAINPEGTEVCDGADNDCNDWVDDAYCSIEGYHYFSHGFDTDPGLRDCFLIWSVSGSPAKDSCKGCDFAFDITQTFDDWELSHDPEGTCEGYATDEAIPDAALDATVSMAYHPDYLGYGPMMIYRFDATSGEEWIATSSWGNPINTTSFDESTRSWTWFAGWEDAPYDGYYLNFHYSFYGLIDGTLDTFPSFDIDEDGYTTDDDCDDIDPNSNPASTEICDGKDNNCDGLIDDDDPAVDTSTMTTWYTDADGDGYGDETEPSIVACNGASNQVTVGDDCDDSVATNNPAAPEVCGDGDDNNCDGLAEEFPACGSWTGSLNITLTNPSNNAQLCDIIWDSEGSPTTNACLDCDFSYEVTFSNPVDSASRCPLEYDAVTEQLLAYDSDYYGYEVLRYYSSGSWYAFVGASFDGSNLSYWTGYYGTEGYYTWNGLAELSP